MPLEMRRLARPVIASALLAFAALNLLQFNGAVAVWTLRGAMAAFGFVAGSWWALLASFLAVAVFLPFGGQDPPGWAIGVLFMPQLALATAIGVAASKLVSLVARRRRNSRASAAPV
jgi:hypothetical protein